MSYSLITQVKTVNSSRYIVVSCLFRLGTLRSRTIMVDMGASSAPKFRQEDIERYPGSVITPLPNFDAGVEYMLKIYDCNVPRTLITMRVFPCFERISLAKAERFRNSLYELDEKNMDLGE